MQDEVVWLTYKVILYFICIYIYMYIYIYIYMEVNNGKETNNVEKIWQSNPKWKI